MDKMRCSRCDEMKGIGEFSKNSSKKNGYNDWCKSCVKAYRTRKRTEEKRQAFMQEIKHDYEMSVESVERIIKVHRTHDYGLFSLMEIGNRPISQKNVDSKIESIQRIGYVTSEPIKVTEDFQIWDGQHRFLALKKLGKPIIYTVTSEVNDDNIIECILSLNIAQKSWTHEEIFDMYVLKKKPEYQFLYKLMKDYSVPFSHIYRLSGAGRGRNGLSSKAFIHGDLYFNKNQKAKIVKRAYYYRSIVDVLGNIKKMAGFLSFMNAINFLIMHPEYDHGRFIQRLRKHTGLINPGGSIKAYKEVIEKIYNIGIKNPENKFLFELHGSKPYMSRLKLNNVNKK